MIKRFLKYFLNSIGLLSYFERVGLWYLHLIPRTCRLIVIPNPISGAIEQYWPSIIATWHGQAYILPFALPIEKKIQILISNSSDGQIFARTVTRLGQGVIVGSGAGTSPKDMHRKRGIVAFFDMLQALKENISVASTADIPKTACICGQGIIQLARRSGRPIVPVAVMTSHRWIVPTWDSTVFNLPFGRLVIVVGAAVYVESSGETAYLESKRLEVEAALNQINAKAKALAAYWRSNLTNDRCKS